MSHHRSKRSRKSLVIHRPAPPGASPGTLSGDPGATPPRITIIEYGPDEQVETEIATPSELAGRRSKWPVLWINVDGLGDHDVLRAIAEKFKLHGLALADVVNIPQRAKAEVHDEHLFLVARMITFDGRVDTEQVSIFVGAGYVLTFQERVGDSFDQVRQRLRQAGTRIRRSGPDYLAYALVDALIDAYYPILEHYGTRIEALEEDVLIGRGHDVGAKIHVIKRDLLIIRRALLPHREMLHTLLRQETGFMHESTDVYLRDCYDHVIQLLDLVETYRELSSGLLDVHLTSVSNHMNEIMKVLTIFAAIFIPLGFIAGVYGMNFDPQSPWNMPELRWAFGYPAVLVLMVVVASALLLFFRRRGWIGSTSRRARPHERDGDG